MTEFELKKNCMTCKYYPCDYTEIPCNACFCHDKWEEPWITDWLNSFDTTSATKCFEAVNLLKQRLEEGS